MPGTTLVSTLELGSQYKSVYLGKGKDDNVENI